MGKFCCFICVAAVAEIASESHAGWFSTRGAAPTSANDLLGSLANVPSAEMLDQARHHGAHDTEFANRTMHFGPSDDAAAQVCAHLKRDLGLDVSPQELFACAVDPQCTSSWTTSPALAGKSIVVTDIVGSVNVSRDGQACHFTSDRMEAWCHVLSDGLLTPGIGWFALGQALAYPGGPVDMASAALPVAVRCHSYVNEGGQPCHLLSGNELLVAAPGASLLDRKSAHLREWRMPDEPVLIAGSDRFLTLTEDIVDTHGVAHTLRSAYGDRDPRRRRSLPPRRRRAPLPPRAGWRCESMKCVAVTEVNPEYGSFDECSYPCEGDGPGQHATCELEQGSAYAGWLITTMRADSPQVCCDMCSFQPACVAWVHESLECRLYATIENHYPAFGTVTGRRPPVPSPVPAPTPSPAPSPACHSDISIDVGCVVAPDLYAHSEEADAAACCALCDAEAACVQWVYYVDGRHCARSSLVKPVFDNAGATCGTKSNRSQAAHSDSDLVLL